MNIDRYVIATKPTRELATWLPNSLADMICASPPPQVLPLAVARHVKLWHLVELWDITLSCAEKEWTSGVCPRFREELPPEDAQSLVQSSDNMDLDVLLPLLKVGTHYHPDIICQDI